MGSNEGDPDQEGGGGRKRKSGDSHLPIRRLVCCHWLSSQSEPREIILFKQQAAAEEDYTHRTDPPAICRLGAQLINSSLHQIVFHIKAISDCSQFYLSVNKQHFLSDPGQPSPRPLHSGPVHGVFESNNIVIFY